MTVDPGATPPDEDQADDGTTTDKTGSASAATIKETSQPSSSKTAVDVPGSDGDDDMQDIGQGNGDAELWENPPDATEVPPAPEPLSDETMRETASSAHRARSLCHLLTHSPPNPHCAGCMAKRKAKKHFRNSFRRWEKKPNEVTMDQVTMADLDGTLGIGLYRYAIVFCQVSTMYWVFVPLRDLSEVTLNQVFQEFGAALQDVESMAHLVMYCDSHRT